MTRLIAEAVRRSHGQEQRPRIMRRMVRQELGEFLGGELPAPGIQQDQGVRRSLAVAFAQSKERPLTRQGQALDRRVLRNTPYVLLRQSLNGGFPRLANPSDRDLHRQEATNPTQARFLRWPTAGSRFRAVRADFRSEGSSRFADFQRRSRS